MSTHNFLSNSPADLQRALGDVNRKMEEQEAQAKAASLNLPYIDLKGFPLDLNTLGLLEKSEAETMGAVTFFQEGKDLRIGTTNPDHPLLKQKIQEFSVKYKVSIYFISKSSLVSTMVFFSKVLRPKSAKDETVRVNKTDNIQEELKEISTESAQLQKTTTELLEIIFGAAVFFRASDIHLEPEEHFVKFRLRIDGVLQDMVHFSKSLQKPLMTRIKVLSKLKLNVENIPQDGRLTFYFLTEPIDVRVSSLPSSYGEEVVMRLLASSSVNLTLTDLGMRKKHLKIVEEILARPNGMVITTGPTGSGKTTTLYAFLHHLNTPDVKIITLEDPVEYKLEGIVQTPIDHNVDFDFAKGLRAILRQDPEIIMIGEIRDQETAETAMQAALTGHMVFSTLHTNDASGAIPRLINMGVKPFVIAPALSCVIAQRLVRKICQKCKKPATLAPHVLEKISYILKSLPQSEEYKLPKVLEFFHSDGCKECHNLGYKGRVGIYEILENTEGMQKLIFEQASMSEFKKTAQQQGMITLLQDGLLKALEGVTDVEEVFRVAGEE